MLSHRGSAQHVEVGASTAASAKVIRAVVARRG